MKTRSKMILGLASLLGVTAGATAVSGFAWFVTTKTAEVTLTNIGVYNNNPSLSMTVNNFNGVTKAKEATNTFDLVADVDTTNGYETKTGDGTTTEFTLSGDPAAGVEPKAYIDNVEVEVLSYDSVNKKVTLAAAPASGKEVRFVYCNGAALTDISSIDGVNFYDPIWQAAGEGISATKIPHATAAQYISFDMFFAAPATGSSALSVFLDRPTIKAAVEGTPADDAAASVARVAFSIGGENKLTLANNVSSTHNKGLSKAKVEEGATDASTVAGDYTILDYAENCENLYAPSLVDYSVLSSQIEDAEHMFLTKVTTSNVTVHVSIWLEGTSGVDSKGDYSAPIGGEIAVKLPIVAFTSAA